MAENFIETKVSLKIIERLKSLKVDPSKILHICNPNNPLNVQLWELYPQSQIIECKEKNLSNMSENQFDLVVSNCAIAANNQFDSTLNIIKKLISIDGVMLLAIWGPSTLSDIMEKISKLDLYEITRILQASPFKNAVVDFDKLIINYAKLNDLFLDLQESSNFKIDRVPESSHMGFEYKAHFEIIFATAWKKYIPKENNSNITYISVDDIVYL